MPEAQISLRVIYALGANVRSGHHNDDIDSCQPLWILYAPRSSDLLRFELVLSTSTSLALGDLLVGVHLIFNFIHKYEVNSTFYNSQDAADSSEDGRQAADISTRQEGH